MSPSTEEVVIGTDHGNKEEYMDVGKVAVSSVFVEGNAQKSILLHKDMISEVSSCKHFFLRFCGKGGFLRTAKVRLYSYCSLLVTFSIIQCYFKS